MNKVNITVICMMAKEALQEHVAYLFSLEDEQNSSPVFSWILLNCYTYLFAKLQSVELLPGLLLSLASWNLGSVLAASLVHL